MNCYLKKREEGRERMEAPELFSFQRYSGKLGLPSVTMECLSVLMVYWFGKGCILNVSCFTDISFLDERGIDIKYSWSRIQGFLYCVFFIKQNCLVCSVLKALLPWHSPNPTHQKILHVHLGMGSYFVPRGFALENLGQDGAGRCRGWVTFNIREIPLERGLLG